jgi:transketolase
VISTFALFVALKAGDQIRAQIAYPKLHVIMAGGYAGLSDFADGASHQSVEDMAVMRAIPGITVVAPCDATETKLALRAALAADGPVYLRLSREAVPELFKQESHPFELGKGIVVEDGDDVTLVATGTMLSMALAARNELARAGVSARVIDMHTVKPVDADLIEKVARQTGAIVTVEEHTVHGGLGSAVCEAVCERFPVPVVRVGIPDRFGESGAYAEILARAGLDALSVAKAARKAVGMKDGRG